MEKKVCGKCGIIYTYDPTLSKSLFDTETKRKHREAIKHIKRCEEEPPEGYIRIIHY